MGKIPVNIISGFLGSGKTTAIIRLLNQKTTEGQWAVIINEFGKISIDSQTLRSTSSNTGTVFDISGGCICCSATGYFQENLEKIIRSEDYTRIIIEPSGLGGIEMVTEIVLANANLKLMPVICLVDIICIENARLQLLPIYRTQISKADVIVFSKCDLLADAAIQDHLVKKFKSIFPDKQNCLKIADSNFWLSLLNTDSPAAKEEDKFRMIPAKNQKLTVDNYQENSYLFEVDTIFNTDKLIQFFNDHPFIIRAKGHVRTEKGWNLVNFTLSGCIFEPCREKEHNELIIITERSASELFQSLKDEIEKTKSYA